MFCNNFKTLILVPLLLIMFMQTALAEEFANILDSVKVKSTGNKSVIVDVYVNSSDAKVKPELSTRKYEKDKYVIDLLNVTQKGNVSKDTSSSNDLVKNKNVKVGKVEGGTARVILNLDNPDVEVKEVRYHIVPGKQKSVSETALRTDKPVKPENKIDNKPNVATAKPVVEKDKPKPVPAASKIEPKKVVLKQEKSKPAPVPKKEPPKVVVKKPDKILDKPKTPVKPANNTLLKVNSKPKEVKATGPVLIHKTNTNLVAENNAESTGPQIIHKTNNEVQPIKEPVNKAVIQSKPLTKPVTFKPNQETKPLTKPVTFKPNQETKPLTKPVTFKPNQETKPVKPSNIIPKSKISLDLPGEKKNITPKPDKAAQNKQQANKNQVKPNNPTVSKKTEPDKPKQTANNNTVQPVKSGINFKSEPKKPDSVVVKNTESVKPEIKPEPPKIPDQKPSNLIDKSKQEDKTLLAQAEPKPTAPKKVVDPEQVPLNIDKNTAESEVRTVDVNAGGTDLGSLFFTLIGALVIIIPLIFIVIWLINIFHKGGDVGALKGFASLGGEKFKIISSTSLGQGRSIHLVEIKGRQLVIGCTNNSINILTEFSDFDTFVEEDKPEVSPSKPSNITTKYKKGRVPLGSFADLYKDYKTKIDAEELEDEY